MNALTTHPKPGGCDDIPFRYSRLAIIPRNDPKRGANGHQYFTVNLYDHLSKIPQPPFQDTCRHIRCIEAYCFLFERPIGWPVVPTHLVWVEALDYQEGMPIGAPQKSIPITISTINPQFNAHTVTLWSDTDPCCAKTTPRTQYVFYVSQAGFVPLASPPLNIDAIFIVYIDVYFKNQGCGSIPREIFTRRYDQSASSVSTVARSGTEMHGECSCSCPFQVCRSVTFTRTDLQAGPTGSFFQRINLNEVLHEIAQRRNCSSCLVVRAIEGMVRIVTVPAPWNAGGIIPTAIAYPADHNQLGDVNSAISSQPTVMGHSNVITHYSTLWLDTNPCQERTTPPMFFTWYWIDARGIALPPLNVGAIGVALLDFNFYFRCQKCIDTDTMDQ